MCRVYRTTAAKVQTTRQCTIVLAWNIQNSVTTSMWNNVTMKGADSDHWISPDYQLTYVYIFTEKKNGKKRGKKRGKTKRQLCASQSFVFPSLRPFSNFVRSFASRVRDFATKTSEMRIEMCRFSNESTNVDVQWKRKYADCFARTTETWSHQSRTLHTIDMYGKISNDRN